MYHLIVIYEVILAQQTLLVLILQISILQWTTLTGVIVNWQHHARSVVGGGYIEPQTLHIFIKNHEVSYIYTYILRFHASNQFGVAKLQSPSKPAAVSVSMLRSQLHSCVIGWIRSASFPFFEVQTTSHHFALLYVKLNR